MLVPSSKGMDKIMAEDIAISIIVLTYNHEKYVQKALDSIFMQNISVNYEVLIHDDVSKDGTQEILKTYAKKYPDQVRLFLRKKKAKRVTYALCQLLTRAKGRYIAFLEGDDYWTDKNKLQKQYDFLEKQKKYIAVTHENCLVNEKGSISWNKELKMLYNWHGEYTVKDYWYSGRLPGQTATLMCRNVFDDVDFSIIYRGHDIMGDISCYLVLLTQGSIYHLDDEMSARRYVQKKGKDNWNSIALSRDIEREQIVLQIRQLCWYEAVTGNYNMTRERWKKEQTLAWNYIKNHGIRKGIIPLGTILRYRLNNYFSCGKAAEL